MYRVMLTGGPGAGKTTLLRELAALGYVTVEESARAIIAERLARELPRRPDPLTFAREILARDIAKYVGQTHAAKWVFFDRGVIEALGMVQEVSPLPVQELEAVLARLDTRSIVLFSSCRPGSPSIQPTRSATSPLLTL